MPLVVIAGIPCSGKSQTAMKILNYFKSNRKCVLVSDENIGLKFDRNEVFADAQKEKELRSALKSEVERHLTKDNVVILDSGNYIKGYRYELYCLSKACKTTQCVVHCDILPKDCWLFNEKRTSSSYDKNNFDALVNRFEPPDSRNRWDSPLILVRRDESVPLQEVEEALFARKPPPPNLATQNQPISSTNFLYDLDRTTQEIVKAVLAAQSVSHLCLSVPKAQQKVQLIKPVSAGELARIRRQFISYTKTHPVSDCSNLPNMFVQFLNKNLST